LGESGWAILEFLREHQLAVATLVIGLYLTVRLWRWANGRSSVEKGHR
jgi:hypothetical protein